MPIDLQAKLLRVIETGEFLKVGESKPTKVNVRIIAATNRNLQKEIEAGHFREDLFYRISVFQIQLPALRERVADIEDLAKYFILEFATKSKKNIKSISPECLNALKLHEWNGNIRELKNVIERSVILMENGDWKMENLPLNFQNQSNNNWNEQKELSAFSMAAAEQLHIRKILNYTNGNKTKTAELLGIALTTLYRKLEEYKIT